MFCCLSEAEKFNFTEANGTDEMMTVLSTRFCPSGGVVLDLSGSHGKYTVMAFNTARHI